QVFLQNFYFVKHVDYFGEAAELMPLLHTWSLAVEEQFYLLIPFVIFLLRGSRARWLVFLALVFVGSLAISAVLTPADPRASFFLLPSRAWEIAAGGIVAVHGGTMRPSKLSELTAWLGIGGILIASLVFGRQTEFPGFAACLPVAGTLLVIFAGGGLSSGWFRRISRSRIILLLGSSSYSIYLWHWPIVAYYRYYFGIEIGWPAGILLVLASVGTGWLSYKYIETPFRDTNSPLLRLATRTFSVSLLLICVGFFFRSSLANSRCDWYFAEQKLSDISQFGVSDFSSTSLAAAQDSKNIDPDARRHVVAWGDSHGMVLQPVFQSIASEFDLRLDGVFRAGTPPIRDFVNDNFATGQSVESFTADVIEAISCVKPDVVILVARWEAYFNGDIDSVESGEADRVSAIRDGLTSTVIELQETGAEVIIMLDPPRVAGGIERRYFVRRLWGCESTPASDVAAVALQEHRDVHAIIEKIGEEYGVSVLDCAHSVTESGFSDVDIDMNSRYLDNNHLTTVMAESCFRDVLRRTLDSIGRPNS
ncbi:MAG: acyltransferase family protein, partial [Phycisphaerales bacterium]|nr:acyltransferase family protein [Phycisphaerales bacterium]